ncbi:MAG: AbrB/MazE/SpoVT family DNA-binding domain-containing protein [Thermoplasmataceae archaeon]
MTLKLKVGKKGYVIIPKAIREAAGVEEGDELIVSLNNGITLTPAKKFNREAFEKAAEIHKKTIFGLKEALSPEPGEASRYSLEDEFA